MAYYQGTQNVTVMIKQPEIKTNLIGKKTTRTQTGIVRPAVRKQPLRAEIEVGEELAQELFNRVKQAGRIQSDIYADADGNRIFSVMPVAA